MRSWGKLWTRYKKTKNPTATQGVRSKSRVLRLSPAHNTTKGVGRPPKPTLDTPLPSPHRRNQLTPSSASRQAREPLTCSRSPLLQQGPQYSLA